MPLQPTCLPPATHVPPPQFNDSRLAVALALTAARAGATVLNHAEVVGLLKVGAVFFLCACVCLCVCKERGGLC